jgi:hypothetical protein
MTAKSPYNNLSVVIREVNLHAEKSSIIGLTTLPLSVTPTDTSLQIKIGEEIFDYETIWATFTPYATAKQMSLNKTIDVTLMNFLYEYFRDKIDLRDDLFFSPLLCLSNERTATLTYNTYFNDATHNTQEYDVFVYRVHPTGQLTYIVDIFKKTTPETQNIE